MTTISTLVPRETPFSLPIIDIIPTLILTREPELTDTFPPLIDFGDTNVTKWTVIRVEKNNKSLIAINKEFPDTSVRFSYTVIGVSI